MFHLFDESFKGYAFIVRKNNYVSNKVKVGLRKRQVATFCFSPQLCPVSKLITITADCLLVFPKIVKSICPNLGRLE